MLISTVTLQAKKSVVLLEEILNLGNISSNQRLDLYLIQINSRVGVHHFCAESTTSTLGIGYVGLHGRDTEEIATAGHM